MFAAYKSEMSAFNPFDPIVPSAAPDAAPNATGCAADGFYTSYQSARRVAVLLSFGMLGIILGLLAIVAVLVRLLRQLDIVVGKLRAESRSEVRGGLLPGEEVDDPENRSGRSSNGRNNKGKRAAKKRVTYEDTENDDEVEHRL